MPRVEMTSVALIVMRLRMCIVIQKIKQKVRINEKLSMVEKTKEKSQEKVHTFVRTLFIA